MEKWLHWCDVVEDDDYTYYMDANGAGNKSDSGKMKIATVMTILVTTGITSE